MRRWSRRTQMSRGVQSACFAASNGSSSKGSSSCSIVYLWCVEANSTHRILWATWVFLPARGHIQDKRTCRFQSRNFKSGGGRAFRAVARRCSARSDCTTSPVIRSAASADTAPLKFPTLSEDHLLESDARHASALRTKGILRFSALPDCSPATTVQCAPPSLANSDHERIAAADALMRLLLVVVRRHDLGNDALHRNWLLDEQNRPALCTPMGAVESSIAKKGRAEDATLW